MKKIFLNHAFGKKIRFPHKFANYKYKIPYVFKLSGNNQNVTFLGCEHLKNATNAKNKELENFVRKIIEKNKKKLFIVTEEEFVKSGFLPRLTKKYRIPIFSCDPSNKELISLVISLKKFKKEYILLWIFLNILNQFSKSNKLDNPSIIKAKNNIKTASKLLGINFSFKKLTTLFKKETGFEFCEKLNFKKIKELQDPFKTGSILNRVGSAINNTRDRIMFFCVVQKILSGHSGIVIFGHNHIYAQEPAYKTLFKELKRGASQNATRSPIFRISRRLFRILPR